MTLETQIEEDIDWRLAELASLKLLLAKSRTGTLAEASLLRALLAMLYAHYEGFSKTIFRLYLQEIEKQSIPTLTCVDPLIKLSTSTTVRSSRNLPDSDYRNFIQSGFANSLSRSITFPRDSKGDIELAGDSNMWANCFKDNLNNLSLSIPIDQQDIRIINQLVGRRNDIAHGQKLTVNSISQYEEYEKIVTRVMYDLAYAVIQAVNKFEYCSQV